MVVAAATSSWARAGAVSGPGHISTLGCPLIFLFLKIVPALPVCAAVMAIGGMCRGDDAGAGRTRAARLRPELLLASGRQQIDRHPAGWRAAHRIATQSASPPVPGSEKRNQ